MKVSSVIVALACALTASAAPAGQVGGGGKAAGANAAGAKAGKGAASTTVAAAAAASTSAAAAAAAGNAASASNSTAAAASSSNSTAAAASSANSADPQSSTTLDPNVIATGFENNGQDVPEAGQVASLTSSNNFINFCLTVPNLPITNGKQIATGSCNPAPMGAIPSTSNMPSAKFTFPANGGSVAANTAFTISMAIQNLETGNFVNAEENYFAAPQQLNSAGQIVGHSHVVVELLDSLTQTTPTNPNVFAFFKGLNAAAAGGVLTADVTAGLPAGVYKLSSINTAANHQPVLVPIAQHGSLDDVVYFTVSDSGAAAASNASSTDAAAAAAATTSVAAAAAADTTSVAAAAAAASTASAAAGNAAGAAGAGAAGAAAAAAAAAKAKAGAAAGAAKAGAAGAAAGAKAGAAAAAGAGAKAAAAKGGKRMLSRMQF